VHKQQFLVSYIYILVPFTIAQKSLVKWSNIEESDNEWLESWKPFQAVVEIGGGKEEYIGH
jgi:hypothetical protein